MVIRQITFHLLVLFFFCCLLSIPLFISPHLVAGHDMDTYAGWLKEFYEVFEEGVFYPQWLPDSNGGYGSPTFIFYAPLTFYIAIIVNFFVHSIILSIKITCVLGFLLSGITMYIFVGHLFNRKIGLIAGIIYQILPYHIIDLYIRGAIAEFYAFAWFPLIFFFIIKAEKKKSYYCIFVGAISYAILILTHLVSGFMFSLVIGFYLLYSILISKDIKNVIRLSTIPLLGLGLSSFYLLPVFFERQYVHTEWLTASPWFDYRNHFITSKLNITLNSFQMHVSFSAIFSVFLAISMLYWVFVSSEYEKKRKITLFFFAISFFTFFMMIPFSKHFWKHIPGMATLQFPWRWQTIQVFSTSFICSPFANSIFTRINNKTALKITLTKIAIFSLLIINFFLSLNILSNVSYFSTDDLRADVFEYRPKWVTNWKKEYSGEKEEKISIYDDNQKQLDRKKNTEIRIIYWKSNTRSIVVNTLKKVRIKIRTFWFPGWVASIDNKHIDIHVEEDQGAMLIDIPAGNHLLNLKFVDTNLRFISKLISVGTLSFTIFFLVMYYLKRKKLS